MQNGEMMKVAVCCRQCKRGKTYHLRWYDPASGKRRNKAVGTDRKRAERQASLLERELYQGIYHDIRRITWDDFTREHLERIVGTENRKQAEYTLRTFGQLVHVAPKQVTFDMIESYAESLRVKGNTQATINKRLRYLRAAFNKAKKRGYIACNPMDGWQWNKEDRKAIRIATDAEQAVLLKTARVLYGFQTWAFLYAALNTGARSGELLALKWDRVDFENREILFTHTKGKVDRYVPINDEVMKVLRRLQVQTLKMGGGFIDLTTKIKDRWKTIVRKAQVPHITIHDLRRTYITRLIRRKVELPTVQQLVGHTTIQTTLKYYHAVSKADLHAAVAQLQTTAS